MKADQEKELRCRVGRAQLKLEIAIMQTITAPSPYVISATGFWLERQLLRAKDRWNEAMITEIRIAESKTCSSPDSTAN